MSGMYFDAVLDEGMHPIFNGTQDETVKWLQEHPSLPVLDAATQVCVGRNMQLLTVAEYLTEFS